VVAVSFFEDLEVFLFEVGDELTVIVADDDVRRDEFDARGEIGLALILRLDRDGRRREQQRTSTPRLPPGSCLHDADYKPPSGAHAAARGGRSARSVRLWALGVAVVEPRPFVAGDGRVGRFPGRRRRG